MGDRLPQRGLLPPPDRRARRRRHAPRVLRADDLLGPQGERPAPARDRPRRVPSRVRLAPLRHRPLRPRPAEPRAAARGRRRAARRLVPRRVRRRRAPGLGHRVRDARSEGRPRPDAPARPRAARRAHARERAGGGAGLAHVPGGRGPVGGGRHRRAHRARDVARLRQRDRPLHAAAARRPGRPDVRDRGRGRHRVGPADLHARVRHDHEARDPGRPRRAARLLRRARGGPRALRRQRAARGAGGRRADRRLRPDDAPGPLHGLGPQPAPAVRPRRPHVGPRRRHVGPDAVAHRPRLPGRRPRGSARVLGRGQRRAALDAAPARAARRLVSGEAVIVGGGPNGLAAAIRLAEAGRPVTVLEAADRVGGAVRTEELTLPGFKHDTFSSVYPAAVASPVFARMPLERHGLRWVHPAACSAHPLPDGSAIALYRDVDATAASLDRRHAGDGEPWRAFVAPLLDAFPAVRATMLGGFPPLAGPLRLIASAGLPGTLRFGALVPGSARWLGRRLFQSGDARAWLYGAAGHGDALPTAPGSAIAAVYLNLMGHAVGWPSPEGGAERLIDALVGYLRELGGTVRTSAPVERLATAGGRVAGVRLAGGEALAADVVVASVMPRALVAMAGDALPGVYRRLLRRYRYGLSTVKVDWALDGPIPWIAPEVGGAGTVHVAGGEDEMLATMKRAEDGLPERPFLLLGQQSVADPTRAPAGKHTAWAYTHGPQEGVDWVDALDAHVERIEAQVERYAPGFRDRILGRHVLGPVDLERRNANLVGGDVGGGSYRLDQVVFRPVPMPSPYRTPLRGLYLGSAATFPGGAVHGVPGDAAARAALADARRRRRR